MTMPKEKPKLLPKNETPDRNADKPSIYDYLDYRLFLNDSFAHRKSTSKAFSYRKLASELGLSSQAMIPDVLKGRKNLSPRLVLKLAKYLPVEDRELSYFEILVNFNQARSLEEKSHLFRQLSGFRGSLAKILGEKQYRYFSKWYYAAVWTYLVMRPDERNPQRIARELFPAVRPEEVAEAIRLLLELDLIRKTANGYAATAEHLTTRAFPKAGREYHKIFLDMAKNALDAVPAAQRQFNFLMFCVSEKGFRSIQERMQAFQEELRAIIQKDGSEDRICTLCMQLFPNTRHA